jgi:outer membrane protein OmpA-like peptidoglycan-associated protein
MLKSRLVSLLTVIALALGGLVATSASASASSNDATLSSLTATTGHYHQDGSLRPGFVAAKTWYQFVTTNDDVTFRATTTDSGATIHFKWNGNDDAYTSGDDKQITFPVAVTTVSIEVTASDGTTKKNYTIQVSDRVLVTPSVVSVSDSASTSGGSRLVIKVRNGMTEGNYNDVNCITRFDIFRPDGTTAFYSDFAQMWGSASTDSEGMVYHSLAMSSTGDQAVGKAKIRVYNYCYGLWDTGTGWWRDMSSFSDSKDAVNWITPSVTSVSITDAQTTPGGHFKINGPGVTAWGYPKAFLYDPADPNFKLWADTNDWIGNSSSDMSFNSSPQDLLGHQSVPNSFKKASKKTLVVVDCSVNEKPCYTYDNDENSLSRSLAEFQADGIVMYSAQVNYTPDSISNITISPAKGPVAGGNVIRISGHHMYDNVNWSVPIFKIGGQAVTSPQMTTMSSYNDPNSIDSYLLTVPAGTAAGPVSVVVSNAWGDYQSSAKYTYGARPEITSVSPATVANSGGSLVTLTGKNFGASGKPVVTIDGLKSPCVTRLSDTKIVAMVPADANTGAVAVNMISSVGGGSPDSPATLTLAAQSKAATVSKVAPSSVSIGGGDVVVLTGTDFGAAGTIGVTVGGNCANVTASSATSVTFEAPSGDAAGASDIVIGTSTGTLVKAGALTYVAPPGVTSVSPSSIFSSVSSADATVVITGVGFGTTGTIKSGSAAAVGYTATDGGTKISNVVIPTTAAGSVPIVITPKNSTTPINTSVRVKAPSISYFGPNPKNDLFAFVTTGNWISSYISGNTPSVLTTGGTQMRIDGIGFGTSGVLKFGTTVVATASWSDTEITYTSPVISAGTFDIKVVPANGGVSADLANGVIVLAPKAGPTFLKVESLVDNGRTNQEYSFDEQADPSDVFVVTGSGFTGSDNGASTNLLLSNGNGDVDAKITPYDVTSTSFKFHAPRTYYPVQWITMLITTNVGQIYQDRALLYVGNAPQPVVYWPGVGLCTKTAQVNGTYQPASVSLTGPDGTFGATGKVTIDGVAMPVGSVTWATGGISFSMADQTAEMANPWGSKTIVFTPDDSALIARTYNFTCAVETNVTTKLNGSTNALTIAAGTAYTASAEMNNPLPTTTFVEPADGYQWVTAADHSNYGWQRNVNNGLPIAAGDYFVRANIGAATYDNVKYWRVTNANDISLSITGTSITFTPKLTAGSGTEIVYRGALGDGTDGSTADITYTTATTPADAITKVYWQYQDHMCAGNNNVGWNNGLPNGVAIAPQGCGGDATSVSSWDIRVRAFDMISGAINRNIYYIPTYNIFTLKITKKGLTISKVTADKVYDGNANITLGEITVTGAVGDENPTLNSQASGAAFNDAISGNGKAITLASPLQLAGSFLNNYELTNPNIVFTGNIKKADATLRLTASVSSVIMTNNVPVEITTATRDTRNGQAPAAEAGLSSVVLTSATAGVCSISGTTVTINKAGECVINGTQASSANYNASKAFGDDTTTTATVTIRVFAAPKAVQVVADDITVAVGDTINPSAQAIGLLDGDNLGNVAYDYYQGATLLQAAPTTPGTYKVVPHDASLQAADTGAYLSDLKYVAGKLVVTQVPPAIISVTPNHGPEKGGNTVTITGTGLDAVTSIVFGSKTLRKPTFTVNGDGTEITFKVAAGTGQVDVTLRAGTAEAATTYAYDPPPVVVVSGPMTLDLALQFQVGAKLPGQKVLMSGGGLKPNSAYTLVMHSKALQLYSGIADSKGDFTQQLIMPAKACLDTGEHSLTLTGITPDGKSATQTAIFHLADNCVIGDGQAVKSVVKGKVTWSLSGFLFKYRDDKLTSAGLKSLDNLMKHIQGTKVVKIFGYTETDTKSDKIKKANLILAKARCESVKAYFKKKGINAIYYTFGKGGVNPVSLVNQSLNRRVVIDATF